MEVAAPARRSIPQARTVGGLGVVAVIAVALAVCLVLALAVEPKIAYLALVAIAAPVGIRYMFSHPVVAVAVALASHAWAMELVGSIVTPFKIAGILAIVIVSRNLLMTRRVHPFPPAYSYGVLAMLAVVGLGELLAEHEGTAGPFFEFAGTLIIFVLMTQTLLHENDFRTLAKVYVINLGLTSASVAVEVGWSALGESGTRAGGICGQPNVLGNHLAMSLPFALALVADRTETAVWRVLAVVGALGSVYGQWAAASRGGTLGSVAALIAFAALAPRRNSVRVSAMVAAVLVTVTFGSFAPKSFDRVTDTVDSSVDIDTATSDRSAHARVSAEMIPKHPWFGAGLTAFSYERVRDTGVLGGALHSSVLAVAVGYGLPALLLYALLQLGSVFVAARGLGDGYSRFYMAAMAASAIAAITSGLSGTELFRAEQWGVVSLCQIAAFRARINRQAKTGA